jgi:hypothetical protein
VIGFGAVYDLWAMAGRERYEQINRSVRRIQGTEAYETATGKARAVVDLGVERARDVVESKIGNGHGASDPPNTPPIYGA